MPNAGQECKEVLPCASEQDTGHVRPEDGPEDDPADDPARTTTAQPDTSEPVKLEDLFGDDDDDDEFPTSSAAVTSKLESSPEPPLKYCFLTRPNMQTMLI